MKACIPITSWSKREGKYEISSRFHLAGGIRDENREPETSDPPGESWGRGRACGKAAAAKSRQHCSPLWPARRENRRKRRSILLMTLCFIRRTMGNMSGQNYRCSGTCPPWILTGRVCIGYGEIIPRRLLTDRNLCNPSDLRASLDVAVQSRTSMKIEAADILSADAGRLCSDADTDCGNS